MRHGESPSFLNVVGERIALHIENEKFEAFAQALSELCRSHGIALAGEMRVYLMEREDYLFDYSIDQNGFLNLGASLAQPVSSPARSKPTR